MGMFTARDLPLYLPGAAIAVSHQSGNLNRQALVRQTARAGFCLTLGVAISACASTGAIPTPGGADLSQAAAAITTDALLRNISTLASDEFEGRAPGGRGEELTVGFLTDEFRRLGLQPGNPDGTFVQNVPLIGYTNQTQTTFRLGDRTLEPRPLEDIVAVSRRFVPELRVDDSELVFVGYGVVAPEFGWDDFKDVDVRGKTVVMLINDPPVPLASDPTRLDPRYLPGQAMTYYGRWTYKYEIASERGAAAVLIVHETEPAGYPFSVVTGSWGRENFDIRPEGRQRGACGGGGVDHARPRRGALPRRRAGLRGAQAVPRAPGRSGRCRWTGPPASTCRRRPGLPLAQCDRAAPRRRSGASQRVRHLHRALGSPGRGPEPRR